METIQETIRKNLEKYGIQQDRKKHGVDRLEDFVYEEGCGLFENQKRYTYSSPELTMAQRKMDTALRASLVRAHKDRVGTSRETFDDKLISSSPLYKSHSNKFSGEDVLAGMIRRVFHDSRMGVRYITKRDCWLRKTFNLAYQSWEIQHRCMYESAPIVPYREASRAEKAIKSRFQHDIYLENIAALVTQLEDAVTKLNVISCEIDSSYSDDTKIEILLKHNSFKMSDIDLEMEWSYNLAGLVYEGDYYLVPRPYIIMIHNKLCSLLSVLVYAKLSNGNILGDEAYHTTINFVSEIASIVCNHGNQGFTVMKSLEALAIGETLIEVEEWNNTTFLVTLTSDLYADTGFYYIGSAIQSILRTSNIPLRHELATLSKIVGHPFVNVEAGARQLHERTTEDVELNHRNIQRCARYAVKTFIQTHIQKRGRWPPFQFGDRMPHRGLVYASMHNRDPDSNLVREKYGAIDIDEYENIILLPVMEFQRIDNIIPYLKDKTAAMCRNATFAKVLSGVQDELAVPCRHNIQTRSAEVTQDNIKGLVDKVYEKFNLKRKKDFIDPVTKELDWDGYREYQSGITYSITKQTVDSEVKLLVKELNRGRVNWTDTRLLLLYMCSSFREHDYRELISECVRHGDFDIAADYLVTKLVPKELEQKIKPRMFGALHPFPRHKNIMQERNVKRFLEMYSDDQAAALSEVALSKKLYAFRNIKSAYRGYMSLLITVDSSGWNTRWRHGTVSPIMEKTLDRIFDYHIFSSTQRMYQRTLYYAEDADRDLYWDGHEGGVEGQNQETWLTCYINQIRVALSGFDLPYHILGKGDDMRIAVLIPPQYLVGRTMQGIKIDIVEAIRTTLKGFNQEIRAEESYGSEHFFAFGKVSSVDTIELPMAYRKIAQTYGANNAFMAVVDEYVGSTLSNAHSAAKVSANPSHCYLTGLVWFYYYILTTPEYKQLTEDQLIALSMIPSCVGGLPIIFLHNMYVRAESDLFSPFLHIRRFLQHSHPGVFVAMTNFLTVHDMRSLNYISLLKDPYSLPLDRPQLPLTYFRLSVRRSVTRIVRNEQLRELFKMDTRQYTNIIVELLKSANVADVKVFSNLYSCSPEGLVDEFCRKFESARSVSELVIIAAGKRRARAIMRTVMGKERALHRWRRDRIKGVYRRSTRSLIPPGKEVACPAELANRIREYAWGKKVVGITMPPLQHQLKITTQRDAADNEWDRRNHFTYNFGDVEHFLRGCNPIVYGTSHFRPFLGHATRTGNIAPAVQFIEKDTVLSKIETLLTLLTWVNKSGRNEVGEVVESNMDQVIATFIKFFTDRSIQDMMPLAAQRRAGTLYHHLRSAEFREKIVPNMLSNIYQQVKGETNSHITFTTSAAHHTVNFLHIYCYVVSVLYMPIESHINWVRPRVIWAVTTDCEYCSMPIQEVPIRVNTGLLPRYVPKLLGTTEIGANSDRIMLESMNLLNQRGLRRAEDVDELDYDTCVYGVLQELSYQGITLKARLQDRFTHHAMTTEEYNVMRDIATAGVSRTVGATELKWINVRVLTSYCILQIYVVGIRYLRIFSKRSAYTQIISTPSTDLPWYGLVDALHRAMRLPSVISETKRMFNRHPPIAYDSPESAAVYLGILAFTVIDELEMNRVVIKLTYYDNFRMSDTIVPFCYIDRWAIYRLEISEALGKNLRVQDDIDLYPQHRLCLLWMLLVYDFHAEWYQERWQHIPEPGNVVHLRTMLVALDEEHMPGVMDDEFFKQDPFRFYVQRRFRNIDWEVVRMYCIENLNRVCEAHSDVIERYEVRCEFSTVESVIAVVRAGANPEQADEEMAPVIRTVAQHLDDVEDFGLAPLPRMRVILDDLRNYGMRLSMDLRVPLGEPEQLPSLFLTTNRAFIEPAARWRVFSESTQGEAKLYALLQCMRAQLPIRGSRNIACLADGVGGFLNGLASVTNDSSFVFNTLQRDYRSRNLPHAAMNTLIKNGHVLITDAIDSGISDLREDTTINFMVGMGIFFDIITCDAEFMDEAEQDSVAIAKNVARFAVECSKDECLVIVKVYLGSPLSMQIYYNTARYYFLVAYLVRCPASNVGAEHYMIMAGRNDMAWQGYTNLQDGLPDTAIVNYRRYVENYRQGLSDLYESVDEAWTYNMLMPRHISDLRRYSPPLILRYLGYSLNRMMTRDELYDLIRESRDATLFLSNGEFRMSGLAQEFKGQIVKLDEHHIRGQPWDQNTLTHGWKIAMRYMVVAGFEYGRVLWSGAQGRYVLIVPTLRDEFLRHLAWLPYRMTHYTVPQDIFNMEIRHLNIRIRPYAEFCRGVYYALLLRYTYDALHDVL